MATTLFTVYCKLFHRMPYIIILKVRKFHQPTASRFSTAKKKPVGGAHCASPLSLNRDNVDPHESRTDFGDGGIPDDDIKSINSDIIQIEPQEKEPCETCRELKRKVVKLEQEIAALPQVQKMVSNDNYFLCNILYLVKSCNLIGS